MKEMPEMQIIREHLPLSGAAMKTPPPWSQEDGSVPTVSASDGVHTR